MTPRHRLPTKAAGAAAGLALLLAPGEVRAHLVTTGLGPVYDGIGHLLATPEDLIPALALALYAGLRGTDPGRRVLFLLPPAWLAGGLAGMLAGPGPGWPLAALSFMVLGLLVAADLRLPAAATAALALVLGLVHGWGNGAALAASAGVSGLLGIALALFVLVAVVAAGAASLERTWARVAVRVAGSWVFASGLLMAGWLLRGAR